MQYFASPGGKRKKQEKKGKGKGRERKRKGRKRGDAKYCNFVGPAFYSCILSKEKASKSTTFLPQKFKTNMPIVHNPSAFKNLRSTRSDGEREVVFKRQMIGAMVRA